MAMEEDLIARLIGSTAIGAMIGDRANWGGRVRGDAPPSITLHKVSPGREWTHDGPDGVDRPRVQFDCFGATDDAAAALSRLVRAEMETPAEIGATQFHPAMLEGEQWIDEGELDGGDPLFRVLLDLMFYHEEL